MFIDLNRFKLINDTYGHAIGDKVLRAVAQRMHGRVRLEDALCHYGGDELLYLLVNPQGLESIQRVAEEMFVRVAQPVIINDLTLTVEPIRYKKRMHSHCPGLDLSKCASVPRAPAATQRQAKS